MLLLDGNTIIHLKWGKRLLPANNFQKTLGVIGKLVLSYCAAESTQNGILVLGEASLPLSDSGAEKGHRGHKSQAQPCATKPGRLSKTGVKLIEAQNRTGSLSTVQEKRGALPSTTQVKIC